MTDTAAPAIDLRLNPDLDPAEFAAIYKRDGLVQIPNILPDDVAESVFQMLARSVPWKLVYPEPPAQPGQPDRVVYLGAQDVQRLGQEEMQRRIGAVMTRARDNYGYLYNAYPMIEAYMNGWDPGHPLHALTEFINSRDFLDFGQAVIGHDNITKADAQATYYGRGHFLTRHVDEGYDKERRAAYTLGFSKDWQPDWGGLLLFMNDKQDITQGFLPRFNTLSIFDGTRLHSVSPVSPFAGSGRFQITGWMRDDPPYKAS